MSDLISRAELFNRLATAQDKAECFAIIQSMPTVEPLCSICKWREWAATHFGEIKDE